MSRRMLVPVLVLLGVLSGLLTTVSWAQTVQLTDATGVPLSVVLEGETLHLQVEDPSAFDTVDVTVTTSLAGDSEVVTLTELSATPGRFVGSLTTNPGGLPQPGTLETATDPGPPFSRDTITATYGSATAVATLVGSQSRFVDAYGNTRTSYAVGETFRAEVRDQLRNDPGLLDSFALEIYNQAGGPGTGETVTMTESDFDTGTFEGSTSSPLYTSPGETIALVHTDGDGASTSQASAALTASETTFIDAEGVPTSTFLESSEAHVRVVDTAADFDPLSEDTVGIDLSAQISSDFETLTLTETGQSTGVFEGSIPLSINPASSTNGVLETGEEPGQPSPFDTLTATYFDPSGTSTDTSQTLGSRTWFIDADGRLTDFVVTGELAHLRVEDPNRNTDPGQLDTTTVDLVAATTLDAETVNLLETAKDSGIFEGSIATEDGTLDFPGDGALQLYFFEEIQATHADALGNSTSQATAAVRQKRIDFVDATGTVLLELLEGSAARIRVIDHFLGGPPNTVETVTAVVTSLQGGDSETVTLTETGPETNTFTTTLPLTLLGGSSEDGALTTASSGSPQFLPDTLTATYVGPLFVDPVTTEVQTVGSYLAFLDAFGNPIDAVTVEDLVRVRLIEPSRDDPGQIDTVTVTLQGFDAQLQPGDSEPVVLTETGFSTGIFEGSIPSTRFAAPVVDAFLWLDFGFFAELQHSNFGDGTPNTLRVPVAGSTVEFVDASGNPVEVVLQGAEAIVRVFDPSANFDPGSVDFTGVDLETELSGDFESLNLTETGNDTNVFVGSINTSIDPASPSDGVLQVTEALTAIFERDTITATHFDPYGASTDTVGTLGSRTLFIDSNGNPIDVYAVGGIVYVRVEDANRNTDAGQFDTTEVDVYAPASGDTETLFLLETSKNSGVFEGSITLDNSGAASPDGLLQALPGDTIDASHADALGNSVSTDTAQVADLALEFFDAEGAKTEVLLESDLARVRLTSLGDNSDPGLVDTATVDLSSLYGGDSETLVLTETHPNSGMFEGALGLTLLGGTSQDGVLSTAGSGPPQLLPDTVTASRGGMSVTATTVGSRLAFLDGFGQTVSSVATGDTLRVQVVEPSRDDPGLIDTLSVTLQSLDPTVVSVDSETVVLTETGFSTGIFEGAIPSTQDGSSTVGDGQLWLDFGFFAELQHSNFGDGTPNTLRVPVAGSTVEFVDASGNPVEVVLQGAEAFVRVFDPSANFDPGSVDSTGVDLETELSGDFESLNLTETGNDTNVFVGSINTSIDPASPTDGVLQVTEVLTAIFERDTITAIHFDPYGASTDTVGTLGSRTLFIDSNGDPIDVYAVGGTVYVRVEDANRNTDAGQFDTTEADVYAPASGDTETLFLLETSKDSGVFEGSITLDNSGAALPDGLLQALPGDTIDASHADALGNSVSTDTAQIADLALEFFDAEGAKTEVLLESDLARVRLTSLGDNSDPGLIDTATVDLTSLYGGDSETLVLTETHSNSGMFEGVLGLTLLGSTSQDGVLSTAGSGPPQFLPDTVTASRGGMSITATTVGSRLAFLDGFGQTVSFVATGDTLRVRVVEPSRDDPGLVDTLSVTLKSLDPTVVSVDSESVVLTETGFATGIFEGTLPSTQDGSSTAGDGQLWLDFGFFAELQHSNFGDGTPNTLRVPVAGSTVEFVDANGNPVDVVLQGADAIVRVFDPSANFDPGSVDSTGVDLGTELSGDFESLNLTETGNDTNVFVGSINTSIDPASPTDGVLQVTEALTAIFERDTITATHFDPYGASTDTVGTLGSRTLFIDSNGDPIDVYAVGGTVYVRVEDANRNTDAGQFDTTEADVYAPASGDTETLFLLETSKDSGIFEGSITLDNSGAASPDGLLQALPGDTIDASHADALGNSISTDTAQIADFALEFFDAAGAKTDVLLESDLARVRLTSLGDNSDPGLVDTATVDLTSLYGGDSETLALTETHPNSGMFEGALGLTLLGGTSQDGVLSTAGSGPPQFLPDSVTASRGGMSITAITVGSRLAFLDGFGQTVSFVATGDTLRVRVVEPSRDDPGLIDSLTATLQSLDPGLTGVDSETVVLAETGFSTGIFEGAIPSTQDGSSTAGDGQLWLDFGFFAELQHSNFGDGTPNTLRVPVAGSTVEFVDANGNPVDVVLQGAEAIVRVFDPSANFDPGSVDSTGVDLETELSGDFETLNLTETGNDTNVFVGSIGTSVDPASPVDGVLQVTEVLTAIFERDTITATHFDPYGASTDAVGTLGSRTLFIDSNGNPIDVYAVGGTVYIRVEDANRNIDPGQFDTTEADIYAPASGDTETLFLLETSKDSGVFEGSITLDNSGAASPDGLLQALPGDTIDAFHADALGNSISTDTAQVADLTLEFFDAGGAKTDVLLESDLARVRLTSLGDNSDPGFVDTATVDLTSLYGGDSETLVLTETHPNSGMFEGALGLTLLGGTSQDGVLSTAGSGPPQFLPDTVTASRGGMSITATTVGSRLAFLDGFGQTVSFVAVGDTLRVRVVEPSRDDPGLIDTLSVTLESLDPALVGVDSETVVLTETGFATGVFEGSIPSAKTGSSVGDGQLWLDVGFHAELQHSNFGDGTPNTLRVPVAGSTVEFVDANGNPVDVVLQGAEAIVRVFDPSANFDPGSVDSTGVDLETELSGDFESLNLTETGNDTNVFVGSIRTSVDPASPVDGVLQVTEVLTAIFERDTITAIHFDPYGASTDTVGTLGSRTLFIDSNGASADRYVLGDLVGVRVEAPARNTDSGAFDTLTVDLQTSFFFDTETLILTETTLDSGVFEGVTSLVEGLANPNNGALEAVNADFLDVSYADVLGNSVSTDTAEVSDTRIDFVDAEGAPVSEVLAASTAFVAVTSPSANLDPGMIDSVVVEVRSLYGGDTETLVAVEVAPDAGLFEGQLPMAVGTGASFDGLLTTYNSGPPQFLGDSLTASVGVETATVGVIEARVEFFDLLGQTTDTFATGSQVGLRIEEPAVSLDPMLVESLVRSVVVPQTGDSETVTLLETAADSGRFEAMVASDDLASMVDDGLLTTAAGFVVRVEHLGAFGTIPLVAEATVVANRVPVAMPDTALTQPGQSVDIDVSANDSDPELEALTLVAVQQPTQGTAVLLGGLARYTPNLGAQGTDSFSYVVRDASGGLALGTVGVTINSPPTVDITSPMDGSIFFEGQSVPIYGMATDSEDGDLSGDLAWSSDLDGSLGTGANLVLSTLSVGTHTLTATVSDSGGLVGQATVTVTIDFNNPPTVDIASPTDGTSAVQGVAVTFTATAIDTEEGILTPNLAWTSDVDGPIGAGGTFDISSLSVATHTVTASVIDSLGKTGDATVQLTITANSAPVVTITAPADGTTATEGDSVTFVGTSNDAESGDLSGDLAWTSDLDGALGTGANLVITSLSVGTHTITATSTDPQGLEGTATVTLTVNANNPPTVTVTGPTDGAAFTEGDTVNLAGTANDAEDGDLTASIAWTSSLDGSLGNGGTLALSNLSVGTHTLTAAVTDSHGANGSDMVSITVNANNPPTVTITSPANGAAVTEGDTVNLVANANDAEDGDITASIAWTSSLDGSLGSGGTLALSSLSVGTHTLTASVTDSHGANGSDTVSITVNANNPPVVAVTSPADGAVVTEGDSVNLVANANDAEDGDLTAAIAWTSSLDGSLGNGGILALSSLSVGTHTLTAAVTDSHGANGSDTVSITVNANNPPVVTITSPADGSKHALGSTVTFVANALDVENGDLSAAIAWSSDLDGSLGTGSSVATAGLSLGTHTITAQVTDALGAVGLAGITVEIKQPVSVTLLSVAAEDGYLRESNENSGVGSTAVAGNKGRRSLRIGDDGGDRQYKLLVSFDTASLPVGAQVLSAQLRLRRGRVQGTNPFDTHGSARVDIMTGGFGGDLALAASDFEATPTASQVAILSNALSDGAWSEGSLDSAGITAINPTGRTQLRVAFDLDDNDDGGNDQMGYYAANNNNSSNHPQLVITYLD